MRKSLIGVAALVLVAPSVNAQQSSQPPPVAATDVAEFLVFFDLDQATLTPDGAAVVAEAAAEYQRTGAAEVDLTAHTDLSGSPAYNLALSERRAETVERELVRLGVPASVIATVAEGERDPLVPTADGVREAENRRVSILIAGPAPEPAPAPVAAVPEIIPEAGPPPLPLWGASLGGLYGANFRETNDDTSSALAGVEGRVERYLTPNLPVSFEQALLYGFQSEDDGLAGRSAIGADLQGNFGAVHPYIGVNLGGVYGKAVQNGIVAGPEVGLKFDVADNVFVYAKAMYDYQFRNPDWDDGIAYGGLGVGGRF